MSKIDTDDWAEWEIVEKDTSENQKSTSSVSNSSTTKKDGPSLQSISPSSPPISNSDKKLPQNISTSITKININTNNDQNNISQKNSSLKNNNEFSLPNQTTNQSKSNEQPQKIPKKDTNPKNLNSETNPIYTWKCSLCQTENDESYRFCPQCGIANTLLKDSVLNQTTLLKLENVYCNDQYNPCETKTSGWNLVNCTNNELTLNCRLDYAGGDILDVKAKKSYDFYKIKLNENIYILLDVTAPSISKKYTSFWQLLLPDQRRVGPILELIVDVKKQFGEPKERKIAQLIDMGFNDRATIIKALQEKNWDIHQAANILAEHE